MHWDCNLFSFFPRGVQQSFGNKRSQKCLDQNLDSPKKSEIICFFSLHSNGEKNFSLSFHSFFHFVSQDIIPFFFILSPPFNKPFQREASSRKCFSPFSFSHLLAVIYATLSCHEVSFQNIYQHSKVLSSRHVDYNSFVIYFSPLLTFKKVSTCFSFLKVQWFVTHLKIYEHLSLEHLFFIWREFRQLIPQTYSSLSYIRNSFYCVCNIHLHHHHLFLTPLTGRHHCVPSMKFWWPLHETSISLVVWWTHSPETTGDLHKPHSLVKGAWWGWRRDEPMMRREEKDGE